jgi:thiosulfate/3-mercaptopyruvate sulfurtransferase
MAESVKPILSPEEVGKYLRRSDVIVLDARGGANAYDRYQAGHLDGAVFLDLENHLSEKRADASQGGRHPLPHPEAFGKLLGSAGINPMTHVLVYDDSSGANAAARCWWMLRAAGHTNVQVIDGGLRALAEAGLKIVDGPSSSFARGNPYPVDGWKLPMATLESVNTTRSLPDYLIIDVRENYRYRGEKEPIDLIAGHIPGAVNAPYLDNLQPDGRFRRQDELAAQYKAITGDREISKVIVHCGSGVTACHTLLAMEFAGLTGANLYVGSWSEWSRRSMPIARGDNP